MVVLEYQLVQPLSGHGPVSLRVNVNAVTARRSRPVDRDLEPCGPAIGSGSQNQMKISGVKSIDDRAIPLVETGVFLVDRLVSRQRPLVEPRAGMAKTWRTSSTATGR
jgi:hypothetical protein